MDRPSALMNASAGDDEDADDPVDELVERVVPVRDAVALLAEHVHADADQRDNRDDEAEGLDPSERGAHRAGESRRKACLGFARSARTMPYAAADAMCSSIILL